MGSPWRWRKCPRCGQVERASDFLPLHRFQGWGAGESERECPNCFHVAETSAFQVVIEYHGVPAAAAAVVSGLDG